MKRKTPSGQDMELCKKLYMDHYNLIRHIVTRTLTDPNHVEDIVQETFLTAWARMDRLREHPRAAGWLVNTAKNISMDYNRQCQNRPEYPSDQLDREPAKDDGGAGGGVRELLYGLKPQDKAILIQYYEQGLSVREIAAALNIGEGAVKVRLSRARERARRLLAKPGKEKLFPEKL